MPSNPDRATSQPERTAALLWGPEPPRTRGPEPTTSREEIVQTAVGVADEGGLDALSMRAVAEALGVGTMSLYRYVPGKAELVALMIDEVWGETGRAAVTGGWRDELEDLARQEWDMYHRHPWMLEVPLGRVPPGPNAAAKYDANLAAVLRTGLAPTEVVSVAYSIDHLVIGAAKASTENLAFVHQTGVGITEWWERQAEVIRPSIGAQAYPVLQQMIDAEAFPDVPSDDTSDGFATDFMYALGLLLDGVAARVRGRCDADC